MKVVKLFRNMYFNEKHLFVTTCIINFNGWLFHSVLRVLSTAIGKEESNVTHKKCVKEQEDGQFSKNQIYTNLVYSIQLSFFNAYILHVDDLVMKFMMLVPDSYHIHPYLMSLAM